MDTKLSKTFLRTGAAACMLLAAGVAAAATTTTVNLTAQRMTATFPATYVGGSPVMVPMWGFCTTPTTGSCGSDWAPGPTIVVPYDRTGNTLVINLTNNLPVPTSIQILGQLGGGLGVPTRISSPAHPPQTDSTWPGGGANTAPFVPPAQLPRVLSFGTQVSAATLNTDGSTTPGTAALCWGPDCATATTPATAPTPPLKPGTYLYETGTAPSLEAPMGLYGVLIVTEAPTHEPTTGAIATTGFAYPAPNPTGADDKFPYDEDVTLLFSEIDPVQNAAVDAAAQDGASFTARFDNCGVAHCYPAAVNYTPKYFLINGKSFDKSQPLNSAINLPNQYSSGNVLVRLVNAGLTQHTPTIVGLPMALVAEDGNVAPGNPKVQDETLLVPGKTRDALVTPLQDTTDATIYANNAFAVFDRQLSLTAENQLDAGMLAYLRVGTGTLPAVTYSATANQPKAVNDSFAVPLNSQIGGNVRTNDVAVTSVRLVTGPSDIGTNPLGLSFYPDGSFVYVPASGFTGDVTFTYNGNDGTTNTATVTLHVGNGTPVSSSTVAATNDTFTSRSASRISISAPGVLTNDQDSSGHVLSASLASTGDCGSVSLSANGAFTATAGTSSSCSFTYTAVNALNQSSSPATVTVNFPAASGLTVSVIDPAAPDTPITDYRWIIQEDRTFKVDPTGTPSLSTRTLGTSFHTSYMPVVATGCTGPLSCGMDQTVRGLSAGAETPSSPADVALDSSKHYYISILPGDAAGTPSGGDGHGMGGAEFAFDPSTSSYPPVTVTSNAYPWVPAQLSVYIYEDNGPVNGQNDLNENGLGGFNIILVDAAGRSGDPAGQQTYDASGMPLSNWLLGRPGCPDDENVKTNGTAISTTGNIVGAIYTCPNDPNAGTSTADPAKYALAGHALIRNLTPARYDVIAHPAAAREGRGEVWWQTETLEGTPAQDAFTGVKEPVYFQEFGPPGFHTTIGFVNPDHVHQYAVANGLVGTNTITGHITNQHMSRPSNVTLYNSGSYDLFSYTTCQVALNSNAGDGPAIATASCDRDGNFTLTGVPPGDYEVALWDQWLDQIIQTVAVTVPASSTPQTVAMGDLPVLSWFTQYNQNIFQDLNGNGVFDPTEPGLANMLMTTRYRDGGISNQTATDANGNGLLAELFPLFNWYVTEADTTRMKQTGVNVIVDGGGAPDTTGDGAGLYRSTYPTGESTNRVEQPGAYSYGLQGFISQWNTINWGRTPYVVGENGGIQGMVINSTTRPFDDQRYNVQTIWEPGVPHVQVNLYRKGMDSSGNETLTLVDTTQTSSWDDWVNTVYGADGNKYLLGADQVLRYSADSTLPTDGSKSIGDPADASAYPAGKQVNLQCPGQLPGPAPTATPPYDTTTVDPFAGYTLGSTDLNRCYDGFHNWNQIQAAPYDGRYHFPSAAYVAAHPLTTAQTAAGQTLVSLPQGQYVVEAVTPQGWDVVKEEDKNILNGDAFDGGGVPQQFAGIGNVFILPDQATLNNANPYSPVNGDNVAYNATTDLGVKGSLVGQPTCVGAMHRVPDFLSLFPAGGLVAPFAGMDRPLCDRKLVTLADQRQSGADFFVFTNVPTAATGAGIILDDASSEFNAAAPDFGEKASVPFVPVSVKDFNGRELSRSYSDQWGAYNVMTPSSWLVNPPTPSGYGPNMLVTCMNDPGPIFDSVSGKWITDPQYNPAYSNFCYTLPFMPGRTTYLDTPVLPIASFASGYNPADCSYPNATPAIARVDSSAGFGPYLPSGGGTLTITALGDRDVLNPAYAGPFATSGPASQRTVMRHYGFGGTQGTGTVTIGGTSVPVTAWNDSTITVNVPSGVSGELVITAGNGRSSVDAVTVTEGVSTGQHVLRVDPNSDTTIAGNYHTIQAAVDAAAPGDLILINAGTYNELVIMWKPVRLQGVGAASVIINAAKYPTTKLEAWRPRINDLFAVDVTTGNQTGTSQVDPLPTQEITGGVVLLEPSVLGTEEGAGITVLAKDLPAGQCSLTSGPVSTLGLPVNESNFLCAPSRIDGLSITGGDAGGGIYVNGWAHNLEIANNRIYGNAGALNGGVRVGVPYLQQEFFPGQTVDPVTGNANPLVLTGTGNTIPGFGYDDNISIHHNAITKNGTVEGPAGAGGAGGGVSICSGTDGYLIDHNWICGNISSSDGGGIGHLGFSQGGTISNNTLLFNQSFQQTFSTHGGGIVVTGEPPIAGTLTLGTGNVTIDSNLIRGNFAEGGQGGGIRLQQVNGADVTATVNSAGQGVPGAWHRVTVTNNMVVNNEAGWAGGGISMADTLMATVDNNTVASNDSTGIAGVVLAGGVALPGETPGTPGTGRPSPAGLNTEPTSAALTAALTAVGSSNTARSVSTPAAFADNIFWHNRSFFYNVVSGNPTLCSSNDTTSAGCYQLPDQTTTGQCTGSPAYWDIGVLGDPSATTHPISLSPSYSILTAGYPGSNNSNVDPSLADLYCNGSRVTPEFAGVINPPSVKNLQVAPTLDEGNNYVNLRYGPLYLGKPIVDATTGAVTYQQFGDYHLMSTSAAINAGTNDTAVTTHDFDGQARPAPRGQPRYDVGADEYYP